LTFFHILENPAKTNKKGKNGEEDKRKSAFTDQNVKAATEGL